MSFVPTSWKQPVLTGEFTAIGVTRVLEADPPARAASASASTRRRRARCSARCRRCRRRRRRRSTRAAPTASPRCTATGSRSTTAKATTCSAASGILFNHESAAARPGVRHAQGDRRRGPHQARAGEGAAARQPRRQARLGLRRRLRPGDVADAPAGQAGRLRRRHRRDAHRQASWSNWRSARVGLDWKKYVEIDPVAGSPGGGRSADRRPGEGEARTRAGSRR